MTAPVTNVWRLPTAIAEESYPPFITVQGPAAKAVLLTSPEWQKLPRVEIEATDNSGRKAMYSGVAASTLLVNVDTVLGEQLRGEWWGAFVTVDARDDHQAVLAIPEFDAEFTDRVIILAGEIDGKPLNATTGSLQIIVPGEKPRGRGSAWSMRFASGAV